MEMSQIEWNVARAERVSFFTSEGFEDKRSFIHQ